MTTTIKTCNLSNETSSDPTHRNKDPLKSSPITKYIISKIVQIIIRTIIQLTMNGSFRTHSPFLLQFNIVSAILMIIYFGTNAISCNLRMRFKKSVQPRSDMSDSDFRQKTTQFLLHTQYQMHTDVILEGDCYGKLAVYIRTVKIYIRISANLANPGDKFKLGRTWLKWTSLAKRAV